MPVLILDTCVLVAALRSSTGASNVLVGLTGLGRFEIGLTATLVLEYESVLTRPGVIADSTSGHVSGLLDYLCRVGRRVVVRFRVRPSLPDPGDEMVLAAAVACGAEWIVTHNLRHLAAGAARFGVDAVTPGEALRRLGVTR